MKASRFNLFFPVGSGRVVGYNARTGAFLSLTEKCYETIRHGKDESVDTLSLPIRALLAEFGFAVHDEMDELREIRHEMMELRYSKRAIGITVAPTLACNLRCVYCYERAVYADTTMSQEVERAFLDYLEENSPVSGMLHLSWYGGEPLLCGDAIVRISREAKRIADSKRTKFSLSMVTNGTLLTQYMLNELNSLGGSTIQITLDGPKEVTDARKPFAANQGSSYEAIVKNLSSLDFGKITPTIRCNIDRTNEESAPLLLEELKKLDLTRLWVYPAPVLAWPGVACRDMAGICYSEPEFAPVRRRFEMIARDLGFQGRSRPIPKRHYCGGDMAFHFTLGPDGSFYKCWNHLGDQRLATGNILHAHHYSSPIVDWLVYDPTKDETCSSCSVLPLCLGGCPDKKRLDSGGRERCDRWRFDLQQTLKDWAEEWDRKVNSGACAVCDAQ